MSIKVSFKTAGRQFSVLSFKVSSVQIQIKGGFSVSETDGLTASETVGVSLISFLFPRGMASLSFIVSLLPVGSFGFMRLMANWKTVFSS